MMDDGGTGGPFAWGIQSLEIARQGGRVERKESEGSKARPTIIVVEDDPDVREVLRLILGESYEVVGLASGEGLLDEVLMYDPALLILDVNLPGKDGFELCREVRDSPRHRSLPVIFLTVRKDEGTFYGVLRTHADALMHKPFAARELLDTIDRLVRAG